MRECCSCGEEIPSEAEEYYLRDKLYCHDCYDRLATICHHCDEVFSSEEGSYALYSGARICPDCYNSWYFTCCSCGEVYHIDSSIAANGYNELYCRECFYETFTTCDICDNVVYRDDTVMCHCGNVHCSNCRCCGSLHSYDYKPPVNYHGNFPYYGMEIETDHYSDRGLATEMLSVLDRGETDFYLKHDGSLDRGIEIVTHPRGIISWRDFYTDLEEILRTVRSHGGKSFNTDTCGIHIHRSRRDLNELTISKLIWIFTQCQNQIVKLAQRRCEEYASYSLGESTTVKYTYKSVKDGYHNQNRYQALNFTNLRTIEFRVFKGTLKISTIYAYLAFTHFITEYAKSVLISDLVKRTPTETWEDFVEFVWARFRKDDLAQLLIKYLTEKGLNHKAQSYTNVSPIPPREKLSLTAVLERAHLERVERFGSYLNTPIT